MPVQDVEVVKWTGQLVLEAVPLGPQLVNIYEMCHSLILCRAALCRMLEVVRWAGQLEEAPRSW